MAQSSKKCCLIGVLYCLGFRLLPCTRLTLVPRYSGCNQSVCNQPSCWSCQVILAALVAIYAGAHVTAGRAAKLPVWVHRWHHADSLSAVCKGISNDLIAVETVKWDLRVRMGIFSAVVQMCEAACFKSKLRFSSYFLCCRHA